MDVDIDCQTTVDLKKVFPTAVRASIYRDGKLTPHPCGVYFQEVPTDPISGLAAAPYELLEELGGFKIDFLHLRVYDHFSDRAEIQELLTIDPDWSLLLHQSVVSELFQISKHFDLVSKVRPTSVLELADCLALIRPQKRFMLNYYLRDPSAARADLYRVDGDGYAFKKSHAISYALVIVIQLHLIKGGIKL